jgi:hypothetical protein
MSSGKGRVGAGANAMKSVTAASASETPWPSTSPTGTVPPEVQSVSYDECKFHTHITRAGVLTEVFGSPYVAAGSVALCPQAAAASKSSKENSPPVNPGWAYPAA